MYENNIKIFVAKADRARFDDAVQNKLLAIPDYVKIITVPALGNAEANIYGGLGLNPCTSAFAVQDSQGVRGVSTAGHCSESYSLSYNSIDLPLQSWLKWAYYDVGWHTAPGLTVTNQIRTNILGDLRRVTGTNPRSTQVIGGYVCKYGVVTYYTCGYISSKTFTSSAVSYSAATFIRVNNTNVNYPDLSDNGDSGGPWFLTNTAYGIHHGSPGDDPNDAIYMAVNYVDGLGVTVVLNPVFADVPWDYWAWQDIERLYNSRVTGGCLTSPLSYCPNNTVTRAEMAVFLLRGIHGSSYTPPSVGNSTGFNDVPTSHWAAAWIKQLFAEGITGGCVWSPPYYCPENNTTHAEMAVFLLRSKYTAAYTPPPVGSSTGYYDVPTNHWAAAWIKQLRIEGIAVGCGGGNYCPESNVTRAQMAGLLVRAFNLP